ncbi:MAG: hypothetical protein FWD36_04515 [Treponema sp.]|nr:hypothetical protein [Treponema sp.]
MNKRILLLLSLVLLCMAEILALGGGEKDSAKPQKVEVSGRVRLVGNSPTASLVISGDNREWHIEPKEEKKLMHLQQQTVTVKGKEYYIDFVFANGSPAERHYYLKDITVISLK